MFVGRLEADKRPALLLEGFQRMTNRDDAHLTIVGTGPDAAQVRAMAYSMGLTDAVEFTGMVDRAEVARIVRSCDVAVSTSQVETFGVAMLESAAAGLPVVAPDRPPFTEVLPTNARVLYSPDSPDDLAGALHAALSADWDRGAIRASVVERYSPPSIAEQLRHVYLDVLRGGSEAGKSGDDQAPYRGPEAGEGAL